MRPTIAGWLAVLSLPLAGIATAAEPVTWFDFHGGWSTYSMSDVNADIGSINAQLAGSGLHMNEVSGGGALGVALGLGLHRGFSLGAAYDRLSGSSEVGDATGSIRYDLPANAFRLFAEYAFNGQRASGAHVGASAGVVSEAGSVSLLGSGFGAINDIQGSGPLFEAFVGGDWLANRYVGLTGSAGLRAAKIEEIKINGTTVYLAPGRKEAVDYSGAFVRAGLKLVFPD